MYIMSDLDTHRAVWPAQREYTLGKGENTLKAEIPVYFEIDPL